MNKSVPGENEPLIKVADVILIAALFAVLVCYLLTSSVGVLVTQSPIGPVYMVLHSKV